MTIRYQKLFADALKRIPAHSPAWADFNQSDPGVTLVQLFAWIADSALYRLDGIPERDRVRLRAITPVVKKRCRQARVLVMGGNKRARFAPVRFIARKLGLKVYRVDLAAVVSKYIGETEKNLRRVFDVAADGRALLFFDEADALFGRRNGVKDSHDRYVNSGINHLLGRLEKSKGLAILAGNRRENFDAAFLRQFKWIISPGRKAPPTRRS